MKSKSRIELIYCFKLLLIIILPIQLISQTPNWKWGKNGIGWGAFYSVDVDNSNNIYLSGVQQTSVQFGSIGLPFPLIGTSAYSTMLLVKYDVNGKVKWARNASSPNSLANIITSSYVATDKFGHVYVAGGFGLAASFGSVNINSNNGLSDIFLVKYDTLGNVLWAKNFGGTLNDFCESITTDNAGNVFLTGIFTSSNLIFGSDTLRSNGNKCVFITKLDSSGNPLWAKGTNSLGINNARLSAIAVDVKGNAYLTGNFGSPTLTFAPYTLSLTGVQDYYLIKYDPNGNVLWARNASGTNSISSTCVTTNSFNKVFVTGNFSGSSAVIGSSTLIGASNAMTAFTAEYDGNGNVIWARTSSNATWTASYSNAADLDGNVVILGGILNQLIVFGNDSIKPPTSCFDPLFIVKYDSTGNVIYKTFVLSGGNAPSAIKVDGANNLILGSHFVPNQYFAPNNFVFGLDTLTNNSTSWYPYVAKLSFLPIPTNTTGINQFLVELTNKIFPNPFTNKLFVEVPDCNFCEISIYDVTGKLVLIQPFSKKIILNTESYLDGIYFYRIKNESVLIKQGKLIK